jgi:hypothetical protein
MMHHKHGTASAHGFTRRADSTLMNNNACAWKNGSVGGIRHGDYAWRQFAHRLVSGVSANQEYSSPAKAMRSLGALQEEIASSTYCGGAQRENNRRLSSIEELLKLSGVSVALLEKGKPGGIRVRWPITLRCTKHGRKQSKNQI